MTVVPIPETPADWTKDVAARVDALADGLADVSARLQRMERGIHALLCYTVIPDDAKAS